MLFVCDRASNRSRICLCLRATLSKTTFFLLVSLVLGRGIPTRAAPGEVSNEPNVSVAPSLPALSKGGLPTPTTQQGPARQRRQPAPFALFVSKRSLTALASLSLPTALSEAVKHSASWGYPNASSGLMPVVQQASAKVAHSVCKCSLVIALGGEHHGQLAAG